MTNKTKRVQELPPAVAPADWTPADAAALKALARGDATTEQQQRALNWIIYDACGTYEVDYRPDPREHAMVSGKRHVGLQIVKLIKMPSTVMQAMTGKVRED